RPADGATIMFEGVVRNHNEGKAVESIDYEAYLPTAEKEMARVVDEVRAAYPAIAVAVVHRLGHLVVGDASIAIVCASPHRAEARATTLETMRAAAAREMLEETGIAIDPAELVWTSRWITPAGLPKRFDAYFFLTPARDGAEATLNRDEAVDVVWITPPDALA